eukprot:5150943-Amphidinium_carterae.1
MCGLNVFINSAVVVVVVSTRFDFPGLFVQEIQWVPEEDELEDEEVVAMSSVALCESLLKHSSTPTPTRLAGQLKMTSCTG